MLPYARNAAPDCLKKNAPSWTNAFVRRRAENPSASYSWNRDCYDQIRSILSDSTGRRCAFCDGPIGTESRETIEHFRPKSLHPELAYDWLNLFPCCDLCQSSKLEDFDPALIDPSAPGYDFYKYFMVNYKTGELCPSPVATDWDKYRAQYTIELYNLNKAERLQARLRERRLCSGLETYCRDDHNYRWFLD